MIATRTGAARKFNTTVTIAFLSIIAERMQVTVRRGVYDFTVSNHNPITTNPLKLISVYRPQNDRMSAFRKFHDLRHHFQKDFAEMNLLLLGMLADGGELCAYQKTEEKGGAP